MPSRSQAAPKQQSEPTKELFLGFYGLLKQLEPSEDRLDVLWKGLYWVEKKGVWRPLTFLLYNGALHGSIHLPFGRAAMEGKLDSGEVTWVDVDDPLWPRGSEHWPRAFPKVHAGLRAAVADPAEYNRMVERDMPLAWRTGKIQRRLTWRKGDEQVPAEHIAAVRRAAASAAAHPPLPALSTAEYQRIAEIAYDAAYPEERHLPRAQKHRGHADSRHGGMLDLPPGDATGFKEWFTSRRWEGAHPFEIAYGVPHGIMLWPDSMEDGWRFRMWVSDELYHKDVLAMILALDEARIPVDFSQAERLLLTLAGSDDVEVGPYRGQLSLAELRKRRPTSVSEVRWDALPPLAPVTEDGRARIAWVEEHGSMARFDRD